MLKTSISSPNKTEHKHPKGKDKNIQGKDKGGNAVRGENYSTFSSTHVGQGT